MKDNFRPWALEQPRPAKRVMLLYAVVTLGAFGMAGQWDYETQRADACAHAGKLYDAQADVCVKPPAAVSRGNLKENGNAEAKTN